MKTKPVNIRRPQRKHSEHTLSIIQDFNSVCNQYDYKQALGYGKYGQVFLAESSQTKQQVAVKAVPKNGSSMTELMNEIKILSKIDHPNVVKYLKHYHSEKYLYVVMEYCEGEELFKRIVRKTKFTEKETMTIMGKLLRVINHCHHIGIIHRDLKPENVMYSSEGVLKVIDFGLSIRSNSGPHEGLVGTAYYIAPEVAKGEIYTKACDIWSLGVMMYIMLSGYVPVKGQELRDILEDIMKFKSPNFHSEAWKSISANAKDLLKKMLDANYETRITAAEALAHPWFTSESTTASSSTKTVLEALRKYSEFPVLKKNMLNMIVKTIKDTELKEYQDTFLEMDKEKTGLITSSDLEETLTEIKVTSKELDELTRKVNTKGDAFINYTEFVAALIATNEFLTEERLSWIFKMLELEKKI